ncbi:MAG: class I SAM-dependent methyltransferase [Anaerolineae bacterium]|nr:class I SAM-dependent methyltransferase [Anaerolineae bacterium]
MSDDVSDFNKARWEDLAQAGVEWSQPWIDLDMASAREQLDPYEIMGNVTGKSVLCLAGGGGQQSVAFGLLGADVTVIDIAETQLERDQQALAHHGLTARIEQGDMRDLSRFADDSFDLVWNAWAINFVPDTGPVFNEVRRVLRPGGLYRLVWGNPFSGMIDETDWVQDGYLLKRVYADGEVIMDDMDWEIEAEDGSIKKIPGPREFIHTVSTVVNGLIGRGFEILGLWEEEKGDPLAEPGSWEYLKALAPHNISLWSRYRGE